MTWQPMDTAPKDGRPVLLAWPYWADHPVIGRWCRQVTGSQRFCWMAWEAVSDDEDEGEPPMAWMPLPVLPHATDVTPPQGHDRESYTDTQDRDNYFDEDEAD